MNRLAVSLFCALLSVPALAQSAPRNANQNPRPAFTQADPTEAALDAVPVVRVLRPGAVVAGTPANLNTSITLRYGSARPRVVLLLMPGYLGGAGSFDRLARQIVALNPEIAVWAVDRRSNLLEAQAQIATADPTQLAQIVQKGLPVLPVQKVPYMADWGLDTTLKDWRAAVLEAQKLTPNVFLGGHSMGAALTGLYAAYDFAGTPGYDDIKGMVFLDGYPGLMSGNPVSQQEYQNGASNVIGPLPGLRTLKNDPYVNTFFYGPRLASKAAAQARLAAQQPDALAPAGAFIKYPATNLAAAMSTIAERYTIVPFLSLNIGKATNVRETPSLLPRIIGGKDTQSIAGLIDPQKPMGWQSTPQDITDARDFTHRFWTPLSDATEWYFPQRLVLDIAAARLDTHGTPFEKTLPVWYNAANRLPMLAISAEHGVTRQSDYRLYASSHLQDLTFQTFKGAAHLDMTFAKSDQVARWVVDWLGGQKSR